MLAKLLTVSMLLATGLPAQPPTKRVPADLSWIRSFTAPAGSDDDGRENALNGDARLVALLHSSLRQHQFFWHDHGNFTPLPDLVQTFIGVPNKALLWDQRYAVVDGCVPHDCSDRGMLWIDTASTSKPSLIFVATDSVRGSGPKEGSLVHLWLFSSTKLDWQHLPPSFVSSASPWWTSTSAVWTKYYRERVVVVSLVQPSGEIVTLSPELFQFAAK